MSVSFYKSKLGFTLLELLVVISIIGLLASVVSVSLNSSRANARDVRRIADIRQMQLALELYFDSNNNYPGEAGWCDSSKGVTATNCSGFVSNSWPSGGIIAVEQQGFMSKLPIDPINSADYYYGYEPVCGQTQYGFTCAIGSCCAYRLGAVLEDSNNPNYNPGCLFSTAVPNYCIGP
jgi:prepilin-type N-terminal cleavage/methylation domain-containing protein